MKGSGIRNLASCLSILCCVLLTSCERNTPAHQAISVIKRFHDITEMSREEQYEHVAAIQGLLKPEGGIEQLASAYRETKDDAFKERLLFVCWGLSFETDRGVRKRLSTFLRETVETETKPRLRRWAAAGLVQCADTGMENLFLAMLQTNEPGLWNHGARGLWKIGTTNAVSSLIDQIKVRRTNAEFARVVKDMVSKNSNQWTSVVLQSLHPGSAGKGIGVQ